MRRPIDVATMFGVLWLLGSMVIDVLTPKELTVYMIAATTAPAVVVVGLCYYLQFPMIDFTTILAAFWLAAAVAIGWISPKPLPAFIIGGALIPALIAGAVLHWRRYRSGERWRKSAYPLSARSSNPRLAPPAGQRREGRSGIGARGRGLLTEALPDRKIAAPAETA